MSHCNVISYQSNLQAALALAEAGLPVFPVRPENKRPLVKWKAEATTDPAKIRKWWRKWPDAMPAFPTGEATGLSVLDLDLKNGKDGVAALRALGLDPDSLSSFEVATPSGGRHLYFAHPPGLRLSQDDIGPGVDVRASGGLVVAPGATNAKGTYSFTRGNLEDLQAGLNLVGLPAWPPELPCQPQARSGPRSAIAEPSGLPLAALASALMAIPLEDREEVFGTDQAWFTVCRVIFDESGGSEEGNEIWHEWSEGWGGYDYQEAESKWNRDSAYDGDRATVWTILHAARKHGWTHPAFEAWQQQEAGADFPDAIDDEEEDEIAALIGGPVQTIERHEWGSPLMRGNEPIMNQHNAIHFLMKNVDSVLPDLRQNLMTGRDEWKGGPLRDSDLVLAQAAIECLGLKTIAKGAVDNAVKTVARIRQYHPIRDDLARVQYDGKPRLDTWLIHHAGAADTPYSRAVGRKWLIAMVARVMQPGCKHDHMPVLIGPQGAGKSTLCRILAGEYFSDSLPSVGGKNQEAEKHLLGKWLVEVAEMQAMNKSEADDIKAFVTVQNDVLRRAYARLDESTPRQCVFVGTTNDDEFLRDSTGGRRFWPVHVGKIDTDAIAQERDQLFAEARAAYNGGERWWLAPEFEAEHARPMQEAARVRDSWADAIGEWLDKPESDFDDVVQVKTEVRVCDVLERLGVPVGQQNMQSQKRAGDVLRGLGWVKTHTRNGKTWKRPE